MAGRINYQRATYQCIRPGELWQINWLEETGTVVSAVYDIPKKKVTTLISFSEGHWHQPEVAHGDKRHKENLEKWRKLADVGNQASRFMLSEQADIVEVFKVSSWSAKLEDCTGTDEQSSRGRVTSYPLARTTQPSKSDEPNVTPIVIQSK